MEHKEPAGEAAQEAVEPEHIEPAESAQLAEQDLSDASNMPEVESGSEQMAQDSASADPAGQDSDVATEAQNASGTADPAGETPEIESTETDVEEDGADLAAALEDQPLERILEAMIGSTRGSLPIDRMIKALGEYAPPKAEVREALDRLAEDCAERSVELKETASGFRFQVRQTYAPWVARLTEEKPQRYSRAALETLALIAYRQPITRGEIEEVRGVAVSTNIIRTLEERNWVRVVGHKDVPGRPALFATTREFLDYFGMKTLTELPSLEAVKDLDAMGAKLAGMDSVSEGNNTESTETDGQVDTQASGSEADSLDDPEFELPELYSVAEADREPQEISVSSAVEAAMALDIGMSLEPDQDEALDDEAENDALFAVGPVFGSVDADADQDLVQNEVAIEQDSEEPVAG